MPFLVGLGFSLVLIPVARGLGVVVGLVDHPGSLKIHTRPVSVLGGPAVVVATMSALFAVHGGIPARAAAAVAIAVAAGLLDDARPISPWLRMVILGGAGVILASAGLRTGRLGVVEVVGVTALVMASTNAVNLVDGQDMLAGGLSAIAAIVLATLLRSGGGYYSPLGFALGGSLVAFLVWNRPPARIFLGNGGAYGVGIILALLAAANVARAGWKGLLSSGACLGVLGLELILTVIRRAASGRHVTLGDRGHSYDVLADRLGSRQKSTALFWALGAAAGCVAFLLDSIPLAAAAFVAALSVAVAIGGASFFRSAISG